MPLTPATTGVNSFHDFDQADLGVFAHFLADLYVRRRSGLRRPVEQPQVGGADNGQSVEISVFHAFFRGRGFIRSRRRLSGDVRPPFRSRKRCPPARPGPGPVAGKGAG